MYFKTILNITSNRFTRLINVILASITSPDQSGPESNANKWVIQYYLELELHHQMQFNGVPRIIYSERKCK